METRTTYKMVDDRVDLARRFENLVESHATTAARGLARRFASISEYPEDLWFRNELLRQRLLVRFVAGLRREMVAAAEAHREATRQLEALRAGQAEAVRELYGEFVEVRRQARDLYGPRAAAIVGLKGRTERSPNPLAWQAAAAVGHLSRPGRAVAPGSDIAARAWAETLAPPLAELQRALEAVTAGEASASLTLKAKRRAIETFDHRFGCAGRYVKAAYELVRLDELAARVPPRIPRKSRRKTPAKAAGAVERPAGERPAAFAKVVEAGRRIARRLLRLRPAFLLPRA